MGIVISFPVDVVRISAPVRPFIHGGFDFVARLCYLFGALATGL